MSNARQPDWSGADDRHSAPRLNLSVEHAALEAGRQNVAEHHQRLLVGTIGNWIETGIRVGNADEFGLCPVDLIAEDPAASGAVRVHKLPAILAFATGADAGDQHVVSWFERGDGRPDLVDDADAFMAKNAARLTRRDVTLKNMQVGAADRCFRHPDDRVRGRRDFGFWTLFHGLLRRAQINECFHHCHPCCYE